MTGHRGRSSTCRRPSPAIRPPPDLLGWLAEAAGSAAAARYGPIEGDLDLRTVYARHLSRLYGGALTPDNIHLTAGCNQAFAVGVMALAGPGETVVMTNPCYFNHETTLGLLGIEPRFVDCPPETGFLPRVEDIRAALAGARVLALVSPNNPTGAVYPPALLADILDLCRTAGVWLVLDETYRDFLAGDDPRPHDLFTRPDWPDNLVQLYSFSKSFCIPGHRLGAIAAAPEVVAEVIKVMDNLQICAPRVPQIAVARGHEALAGWREENRREIACRGEAMRTAFAPLRGWEIDAIGAYFAFVRHPFKDRPSAEVARRLASEFGVVTIPGAFFGRGLERYLRIAFANAGASEIADAASRLAAAADEPS